MMESSVNGSEKWSAILAEGRQIVLVRTNGQRWTPPGLLCETECEAEHIVRELKSWSQSVIQNAEYHRLCRAGD